MLVVPTYVGPSAIEGVGIFAAEPIPAGTLIWVLEESLDRLITDEELEALDPLQRTFADRYGYPHMTRPGITVIEFDNGRFMNHSPEPNTDFTDTEKGWAIHDIAPGEEITCDYAEFDPGFSLQTMRHFAGAPTAHAGQAAAV
ncbi:SET domain-containing protein [Tsuneonella sp. HG249]